jgi:hypothetical protein
MFSADMSTAVWTAPAGYQESRVMAVNLDDDSLDPVATGIVLKRMWTEMALSADGGRVAVIEDDTVLAFEIGTGALLAAAAFGDGFSPFRVRFEGDEVVRILAVKHETIPTDPETWRRRWKRHSLDLAARDLDDGHELESDISWTMPQRPNRAEYELSVRAVDNQDRLLLVDPAEGTVVADLGELRVHWYESRVVSDHRIVVIREEDRGYGLEVFSPEGGLLHRLDLPGGGWLRVAGEVTPDLLAIGQTFRSYDSGMPDRGRTVVVDLSTGTVRKVLEGVLPGLGRWRCDASEGAWAVGTVASRLMVGDTGSLHLWDPETGDLEQIIPGPR